jgi:cytidine deaminase
MKVVSFDKLSKKDQELIIEAEKVISNAYDPYSQFYVASAILSKKGHIYKGVNINTCSYGGICAERAALSSMVSNGEYCIEKVAIIAKSDHFKVKILSGPVEYADKSFGSLLNYAKTISMLLFLIQRKKEF